MRKRKRRNKLAWILMTAVLCLLLYSLVVMRSDSKVSIIVGGTDGAFIQSDGLTYVDPNSLVETPEPTVNIWPDRAGSLIKTLRRRKVRGIRRQSSILMKLSMPIQMWTSRQVK